MEAMKKDVQETFLKILSEDKDVSAGVAAIRTLLTVIKNYKVTTVRELDLNLQLAVETMKNCDHPITGISSGCELFMRFITFAKLDVKSFEECEQIMLQRGHIFLNNLLEARGKVAKQAVIFFKDGDRILTHSYSRVVLQAMIEAANQNKRFKVFVTMSGPDNSGELMHQKLVAAGIEATLILDSSVGYVMEQYINMVLVGAEVVAQSGGIINKIGTYTIAMTAQHLNKPFHVLAESFKFSRVFPLSQRDLDKEFKYLPNVLKSGVDLSNLHPLVDYTPPTYIQFFCTDLGVLTPTAVTDELLKLYL